MPAIKKSKFNETNPAQIEMGKIRAVAKLLKMSLFIGMEIPVNKTMWEYHHQPDMRLLTDTIKESKRQEDVTDDDNLILMQNLMKSFSKKCAEYNSHFIYCYTYEDKVFYDVDHVGDIESPDKDRMWKWGIISPGAARKNIRAAREPVREYIMKYSNIPLNDDKALEGEDIDALFENIEK